MKWILLALERRVANMLAEAIVRRVDDAKKIQEVQLDLLADETRSGLQRLQEYGFTSVPLDGGRAVALFVGGNRDHGIVIATDDARHRPSGMAAGDVAVYDSRGQTVTLTADGVTVTAATIKLDGNVNVTGAMVVDGNVTALNGGSALSMDTFRTTYNTHTHIENDVSGPTGPPSGTI